SPQPGGVTPKSPQGDQRSPATTQTMPGTQPNDALHTARSARGSSESTTPTARTESEAATSNSSTPTLFISDVATLRLLERRGFDFASVALGVPERREVGPSAADYAKHAPYA